MTADLDAALHTLSLTSPTSLRIERGMGSDIAAVSWSVVEW
jgi:hypothetical protein